MGQNVFHSILLIFVFSLFYSFPHTFFFAVLLICSSLCLTYGKGIPYIYAAIFALQVGGFYLLFSSLWGIFYSLLFLSFHIGNLTNLQKLGLSIVLFLFSLFLHMEYPNTHEMVLGCLCIVGYLLMESTNRKELFQRLKTIVVLLIGFYGVYLLAPYIRKIIVFLITLVFVPISYLFSFFMGNSMKEISIDPQKQERLSRLIGTMTASSHEYVQPSGNNISIPYEILLLLVGIMSFIFFIKKRVLVNKNIKVSIDLTTTEEAFNEVNISKGKVKAPKNKVRQFIYKLEMELTGSYQREKGETIEHWINRLNEDSSHDMNVQQFCTIYNKVRYHEQQISEEELNYIRKNVRLILKEFR